MCGINFIIDKKGILEDENIIRMTQATNHRGPDHTAFYKHEVNYLRIFFGHNRLKILDLSDKANQPFISSDGRYILNFNGEIYNFSDLKNALLNKGFTFSTLSDTEVLLYVLIHYGIEALSKIEGMFAFIFYDKIKETTIIARDHFGMKPLYFYNDDLFFCASSEIKGLISSGLIKKEFNDSQIDYYLNYRYTKAPETFYKNIYQLKQGEFLLIDKKFEVKISSYLKKKEEAQKRPILDDRQIVKETEDLLTGSLLKHLAADVSCGLFLSGGADSTLLLALANKEGIFNLDTFSIVNEKEDSHFGTEDYLYSSLAAKKYHSNHLEYKISKSHFEQFDEFISAIDHPVGDGAAFMTFLLAKEARKKVKVVLNGGGADEIFAGYNRHLAFHLYLKYYNAISRNNKIIKKLSSVLPTGNYHPLRKQFRLFNQFAESIQLDPKKTFESFTSFNYLKNKSTDNKRSFIVDQNFIEDNLQFALNFDVENFLVSDFLSLSDNMSMVNSLEMRMPYLDLPLYQYLQNIPATKKLEYGRKWILNHILIKNRGAEFANRKKEGFGMPFNKWIREKELLFLLTDLQNKKNRLYDYISFENINFIIKEHLSGKKDNSSFIFSLIILDKWISKNF
jgi:asparagine synthase (glutamine-hydrolysing)